MSNIPKSLLSDKKRKTQGKYAMSFTDAFGFDMSIKEKNEFCKQKIDNRKLS